MSRKILHIDMDAFFASIEQRDNPMLRGKPVAVGGGEKRGVVAAASYEARKFGVHSAMPGFKAKVACPSILFVKPRFDVYKQVSETIRQIFLTHSDLVEPIALDEAYLDVSTQCKDLDEAKQLAIQIKHDIFETTKLLASAGVSYNKFLAKLASDFDKPDGLVAISPDDAQEILPLLEVRKFPGIGKVTTQKLNDMQVFRGKDLKAMGKMELSRHFGKMGAYYFDIASGIDDRPVRPHRERKSVGVERTFRDDLKSQEDVLERLAYLSEILYERLRKHGAWGYTLTLKIRNSDFETHNRQLSFSLPLDSSARIKDVSFRLAADNQSLMGSVRLLGLSVSNFHFDAKENSDQLEFDFF